MKIIKDGILETYTQECGVCGCVFEYTLKDMYRTTLGYGGDIVYTVSCPCCDSSIDLRIDYNVHR